MGGSWRWDPALNMGVLSGLRRYVSPGYLDVLSVPLRRGRFFVDRDNAGAPLVAVVNESFAAKYSRTRDVLGLRFISGNNELTTIVGVIADIRTTYERAVEPEILTPLSQSPLAMASFLVKSHASPSVFERQFRTIVRSRYPYLPVHDAASLNTIISESVSHRRFNMALLTSLAALAVVLSAVGIYGVMAYVVSQRRREMAIRVALGARPAQVRALSIRQGLLPVVGGIAGGLAGAWFLTTLLKKELFEVPPHDPWTLALAAFTFFVVGLIACWLPARKTSVGNPWTVLSGE
jgi:ABC-type antimicrobial peptide transport system permease subunit